MFVSTGSAGCNGSWGFEGPSFERRETRRRPKGGLRGPWGSVERARAGDEFDGEQEDGARDGDQDP